MAWNYARYIGRVAEAGKAEYPLPMYVNACTVTDLPRGTTRQRASGGPMPDLMDVWRAGAPRIDMLSPDIYGNRLRCVVRGSTTDPGTRCSCPKPGATWKPGCSTPSDAMTPSELTFMGVERPPAPETEMLRGFAADRAIGAPDWRAPGERHHVRRPGWPEGPAQEGPVGKLHV